MLGFMDKAKDMAINAFLNGKGKDIVNSKIGRYGTVQKLMRENGAYHADVQLKGSSETLSVTLDSISINDDCSAAKLGTFHANAPWLENLLADFGDGREVPIPEGQARLLLAPFKNMV